MEGRRVTFICALWQGDWVGLPDASSRNYSPVYVERLKDMICRSTSYDVDFLCLSNLPASDFREDIRVEPLRMNWPAWWSKIEMFNPDLDTAERVVTMDIDVVITGNLDSVIEHPAKAAACDYWSMSSFTSRRQAIAKARSNKGKKLVPEFSTNTMVFDKGIMGPLFKAMDSAYIDHFCGDQDYIGADHYMLRVPLIKFPRGWFRKIRAKDRGYNPLFADNLKALACHPVKNHELRRRGYTGLTNIWEGKNE